MKIQQLLSGMNIVVTNEEQQFISKHNDAVRITALDDHDRWLAQNLVRKGVYAIGQDSNILQRMTNGKNT